MDPASVLTRTFLIPAAALRGSNCCSCTVILVTLVRIAFLGLLTVLGSVYSTYAADMTRQPSILNSSIIQRLEAVLSRNTLDHPVN